MRMMVKLLSLLVVAGIVKQIIYHNGLQGKFRKGAKQTERELADNLNKNFDIQMKGIADKAGLDLRTDSLNGSHGVKKFSGAPVSVVPFVYPDGFGKAADLLRGKAWCLAEENVGDGFDGDFLLYKQAEAMSAEAINKLRQAEWAVKSNAPGTLNWVVHLLEDVIFDMHNSRRIKK